MSSSSQPNSRRQNERAWVPPLLDPVETYDASPSRLAARLKHCMPLLQYGPVGHNSRGFRHRSRTGTIGAVHLTIGYTSPFAACIGEQSDFTTLNLCLKGAGTVNTEDQVYALNPFSPLVFTPGEEHQCTMNHYLGIVIRLPKQLLISTAEAMAGIDQPEIDALQIKLNHAQSFDRSEPRAAALIQALQTSIDLLVRPGGLQTEEHAFLKLDDHIARLMTLLLSPRLSSSGRPGLLRSQQTYAKRTLSELQDWIQARLDQPLTLSDLEQRSGYSRRNLQLLFQQHHHCTPSAWVRQRRLEAIQQRLLQPHPQDTVGSIALDYGFTNASSFARLFKRRFGLKPSELLRRNRQPS